MINFKEEKGITFMVLVITIIVMLILAGVSINIGLSGVSNSSDKQDISILYMVQQAVLGQYSKAMSLGNTEKKASDGETDQYFGEKIYDISEINVEKITLEGIDSPFSDITLEYNTNISKAEVENEEFYYRLKSADLKNLKITKPGTDGNTDITKETTDTFIVNYKTGEVYNETKQITTNKNLLFIKGQNIERVKPENTNSFVD